MIHSITNYISGFLDRLMSLISDHLTEIVSGLMGILLLYGLYLVIFEEDK